MRVLLSLFLIVSFSWSEYKPLSRKERKAFKRSAEAIAIAKRENNIEAILRFAPGLLKDNESILLDPNSKQLREAYRLIGAIYKETLVQQKVSDAKKAFNIKASKAGDSVKIVAYQDFLDFLKAENLDSLFTLYSNVLYKHQSRYLKSCAEVSCLHFLSSLKYYNKSLWLEYSKKMDVSIRRDFVELTNSLDRGKILKFKRNYPGVYGQDINSLLEKSRQQTRLSLMKHPSVEGILRYFSMYKIDDKPLQKKLESILYKNWEQFSKIEDAERYVRYFPNTAKGRRLAFWVEEEKRYMRDMQMIRNNREDTLVDTNF